jgi:hypothetical protein
MESALLDRRAQVVVLQPLQNLLDQPDMRSLILRVDQYIIDIDDHSLVEQIAQHLVYHRLEGSRCIAQPKRHYQVLKQAISRAEGCFPFIALGDADEIVTVLQVQLGEYLRSTKAFAQFSHKQQRGSILDRHPVQASIVDAQSQAAIWFRYEDDRRACRRL